VLTSIADGHATLITIAAPADAAAGRSAGAGAPQLSPPAAAVAAVDPCRSLTRIGVGGEARCRGTSSAAALRRLGVGNELRLRLVSTHDEATFATAPDATAIARAAAWEAALRYRFATKTARGGGGRTQQWNDDAATTIVDRDGSAVILPRSSLSETVVRARAVASGAADAIVIAAAAAGGGADGGVPEARHFLDRAYARVRENAPSVLGRIERTRDVDDAALRDIDDAITSLRRY
jgi:hypothetical protein